MKQSESVLESLTRNLAHENQESLGGLLLPAERRMEGFNVTQPDQLNRQSLQSVMESYVRYYAFGEGHTARAKRYDLQYFLGFLAGPHGKPEDVTVSDWTLQATKDFVDERLALGEAPATVARRLATIKHLGRTLAERVHGFVNPAREAKGPVLQPTRPSGLGEHEIQLLREAAFMDVQQKPGMFSPVRNRFLLELLLATGLRADEVRLLVLAQVSDDLVWLKNVKTKGKKFRNVYLDSSIRDLFQEYLQARDLELSKKFTGYSLMTSRDRERFPVLISMYGASLEQPQSFGLSPKTIWRIIATFGVQAQGLSDMQVGSLHPHKLRHTFAHGLLDTSKDVRLVAQALGHSDVRTTMRYTERTDQEIAKAIEQKILKD